MVFLDEKLYETSLLQLGTPGHNAKIFHLIKYQFYEYHIPKCVPFLFLLVTDLEMLNPFYGFSV